MRIPRLACAVLLFCACARPAQPPVPLPPADREDAGAARPATGPSPSSSPDAPSSPNAAAHAAPDADGTAVAPEPRASTGTAVAPEHGADAGAPCPAPGHGPHCLWLATTPPNKFRARLVAKRLVSDGYDAVADSDRVIVHMDDAALTRLYGSPVAHERHAASASNRMRCVAVLPRGAKLPARYRTLVGPTILDDPACEM